MRKQQRFSLHCLPGCGTIAVLRQGSTTMKTTAMTAEERVRYMTQAPVRRLILEMSAPTVILCTMLLQTIGMAWQASVVAAARQGLFLIPVVFILPNLLGQYRIILSADTASEVRHLPERCLSRKAGIVRCCLRACRRGVRSARRGSAGLCAGAAYGAVRAEDVSQ